MPQPQKTNTHQKPSHHKKQHPTKNQPAKKYHALKLTAPTKNSPQKITTPTQHETNTTQKTKLYTPQRQSIKKAYSLAHYKKAPTISKKGIFSAFLEQRAEKRQSRSQKPHSHQ